MSVRGQKGLVSLSPLWSCSAFWAKIKYFGKDFFELCVFLCVHNWCSWCPPPPQLDQPDFQLVVNNLAIPLSIPIMLSIYCTAIFNRQYSTLSSKCAKFCNSTLVSWCPHNFCLKDMVAGTDFKAHSVTRFSSLNGSDNLNGTALNQVARCSGQRWIKPKALLGTALNQVERCSGKRWIKLSTPWDSAESS